MKSQNQYCRIDESLIQKLSELSVKLQSWLTETGSLTQRLRDISTDFQVKVLKESWEESTDAENSLLQITEPKPVWVRETLLCDRNTPLIFARSIFPQLTLTGRGKILQTLGDRSLGDFLFTDPNWHRDPFEFNLLSPQDFFWSYLRAAGIDYLAQSLWARSSRFYFFNQPLIITEVFLPDLINRIK